MFATLYNKVTRGGRRLAAFIALLALTTSSLVALEPPPPAAAAIVTNNLVLNLDGNSTTSLAATSPTTWNSISPASTTPSGTINGPSRYTETNRNGLTFTSSNGVYFPAGTARTAGDMSFDAWVRPGNLNAEWNLIASRWFTSPADGAGGAQDWHFGIRSGKLHLATASTGSAGFYGNTTFPQTSANKWYHVGFTINASTGKAQLFINGQADSLENNATHTDNATAQLWLGENRSSGGIYGAPMVLSKVRIYNAALTASQQAQNYLTDSANYGYAPANTVAPSTTGIAKVGTALSTSGGTWGVGDADGTTTSYQWQTSTDSTNWTNITGATNATYTPVAGDATNFLRVSVTKTNTAGSSTATSASTFRVQTASGIAILSGNKLTGLTSTVPNDGTTYNVTLATNNLSATMRLGTTTGLTIVKGYASTASYMATTIGASAPIITFRGTGTAINTALANVTYTSATQQTDVVKLYYATAGTTTTDTKDYIPIYDNNQLTFHYYAFKIHAAAKNRAGMDAALVGLGPTDNVSAPGPWYLVTTRYEVEWDRVKLIAGQNNTFMGAYADAGSANWYWPANTDGYSSATIFGTQSGTTVTATSNVYNQTNTSFPFHTGEPNGGTAIARSGFFYISNSALGWDDVPADGAHTPNFTMETFGTEPFNSGSTGVLTQTVSVVSSSFDPPTGLTVEATGTTGLSARWNSVSPNLTGITLANYRLEYSTSPSFSPLSAVITQPTPTSGLIQGLTANTTYYVRVLGVSATGGIPWGAASPTVTIATKSSPTTITVVASGGGIAGTDYTLSGGQFFPKSSNSVSIAASAIQSALNSGNAVLAADNVIIDAPITWSTSSYLTLGNSTTSSVTINKTITSSANFSQLLISPTTYALDVKNGASIQFTSANTQYLNIGGVGYTLIKTEAQLVAAAASTNYALAKPLTLTTSYTASPISQIYSATFDGLGNSISSLKLATGASGNYGLFNSLTSGGIIRNLGVTNAEITLGANDYRVGVIAGVSTGGTIDQVWSTGFIRTTTTNTSLALGGLVGNAPSGTVNISRSWSSVNIDSSTSGTNTRLEQGGIIGGNEADVGQIYTASGGSINLSQVYATGTLKWGTSGHRGIGGLMGLHYANATTTITDAFSWVTFASGSPSNNRGGIIGVAAGGTSTATRTYQTTFSECVAGGGSGFTATPNCSTMRVPGETVSGISGANWAASGATVLVNLAAPAKPLYVQVVAPTDGSYATVSYQIVDGSGAVQNATALSAMNLSVSGTPVYKAAGVVLNAASAKATYAAYYDSGLTLGGSSAGNYSLGMWRDTTSVTISKYAQTVTWAPTTSVSFGSGTFTPSPAPVASGGTTITYSVSSAGTTGCTVNSTTGAITYTRGGSCAITATAASAGDWLIASDTETFVIAEPATAPTGLAATTAGSGVLNIGWAAPTVSSSAAITGYTLTYSTNSGMTSPTTVNVGNTRGYLLTGLTPGTVYYFQVRAVSGSTWTGPLSTTASATPNSTATTINVVASGGGAAGTDYTINGGVISTTGTASVNASVISNLLASEGTVQLAATTVNVNAAISWSANSVLVLGNTSAATVNVNSTIAGSGNTAGVSILPSSYGLLVKSGAHIRLTGTTPSFNLGGTSYTVVNTVAGLSNVVAGSTWALTAPITLTAAYTAAVRDVTFTGIMDGLGNTISNMDITATVTRNAGFYAALGGATVRNVGFTNVNIKSPTGGIDTRLGSVAGNGSAAGTNTVTQVWATGFINQTSSADSTRTEAGGLFGGATAGTLNISKSWSSVSVSTNSPGVGSGGIIGANVSTFAGGTGTGNTLTISESYSTGNILRSLPPVTGWYGNGGIIGVAYGVSATMTNVFSWGNVNTSGTNSGNSVGGIVGVPGFSNATVTNAYTTSSSCGGSPVSNCIAGQTAGTAVSGGTGFTSGVWQTVNGTSLVNLAAPTKTLYAQVIAPANGAYSGITYQIVDSTGTVQSAATLTSLGLTVTGTPAYTIASDVGLGTYPTVSYVSGLALGGSSAGVYSLAAWVTATSVTISKLEQTVTWAPTTSYNFGNGSITPSSSPVSSGGTAITYSVTSAGTTGCSVNSTLGLITYLSAGTCEVTATAASSGNYLAASKAVSFVIGAAPTITVVSTGGGTPGTDFVLSGGVLSASANVSVNASYLATQLASGNVTLAGNVVVSTPITWSGNFVLTLGGTSTNTVAVNASITGSGNTAGIVIKPNTYSLSTKDGAAISLTGTTPTLSIGGNSYTLIKAIADLSTVTATAGTFWALAKPLTYTSSITTSPIDVFFAGTFDGLGNTVDNLRITSAATDGRVGFIKNLNGGTVRNLGVTRLVISLEPTVTTSTLNSGGLAGDSAGGSLDQVWTTGNIRVKNSSTFSSLSAGGLIGDVYTGTMTINKSWSSLSIYGWNSTFTNAVAGGLVGGNLANWSATSSSAGGNITITQSYATGDIAIPLTSGIHGYGGIMGVHLGTSAVSVSDVFSWSQISINSGAKYGGIFGNSTGSTAGLQTAWTTSAQAFPSGAAVSASNNTSVSIPLGTTPSFTTNANWYQSVNNRQLVNLPMAAKNLFVKVGAPTNGAYGTLSYSIINGVEVPQTPSSLGITVSGTPTYSIDSDVAISATPYLVTYVSGLEFAGTGTRYSINPYLVPTSATISKYAQSISFGSSAPTTAAVGSTYTPTATASSSLAVAFTIDAASSSVCSIASGVVTFNAIGDCVINANQAGNTSYLAASQVQQTAKATAKGAQTVSFSSTAPSAKVNGSTYTPTGTATSGLSTVITVASGSSAICSMTSGVVSFAAVGDCVLNINQAGSANWNPATQVQQTVTVAKGDQTITFSSTAPPAAVVSGTTYTPAATSTSSGVVAFTIDGASSAVCSIAAGVVSFQTAGTCKVLANQAGNTNWNAATQNFQTFTVGKGTPTLAFTTTATSPKVNSTYTPAASSASTGVVTYSIDGGSAAICEITGGVVSFKAVGTCTVNANQASDANWLVPVQKQQTITVIKGDQSITFTSAAVSPKVNTTYTPTATSTSGGAVVFTIDSASSSVCTMSLGIVIFSHVGTCRVNANQSGGDNWNSATQVQQVITVAKGEQTVTISSTAPSAKVAGSTYTPTGTSTSGLAVTFSVNAGSTNYCSISGGVVSFLAVGSCVLNANQAGDDDWNAATQQQQTISVGKGISTIVITSTAPSSAVVAGSTYTITSTKTAANTNAVVYSVDSTTSTICSVSGDVVSFLLAGTCKVNANLANDTQYETAAQQQQVITVGKGSQVVTFTSPAPNGAKVGAPNYTVTATGGASTSEIVLTVDSSSTTKCSVSGMVVTYLAVGDCVLNLNQAGDTNYLAATQAQQTITITTDGRCPNGVVSGNYCLIRFNTSGSWTVPAGVTSIDILTVGAGGAGGGGAGGNGGAGGGGGGEVRELLGRTVTPGTVLTTSIGAGGIGGGAASDASASTNGGSTSVVGTNSFASIIARGGGAGATWRYVAPSPGFAQPAGTGDLVAGGGGGHGQILTRLAAPGVGGVSSGGTGNADGSTSSGQSGGGGGGAGGNGANATPLTAGNGGPGLNSVILGTALGGGGGGAKRGGTGTVGTAVAGGGAGGNGLAGVAGAANTGGGGGGSGGINNGANGGSGVVVIRIALQSQTVSFTSTAPTGLIFGTSTTYTPSADGTDSELPATISVDSASSSVCSINAGVVSIIGAGTCTLNANQAGNGFYSPANQVQQSFTVAKQAQSISFTSTAPTGAVVSGASYTPTATSTSDGAVVFTIDPISALVCSNTSGSITFQSAGICKVLANQAGDDNWNAASQKFQSFIVGKGTATLVFTSSTSSPKVGATYAPVASSSSTGIVSYSIDSTSASVCEITDGIVSFNTVGTCNVNASQLTDDNWLEIDFAQQSITVTKGDQVVEFSSSAPLDAVVDGSTYTPSTTGGNGTASVILSVASASAAVCSIASGVVTFLAVGDCVVKANQAGDDNYLAASELTQTITVGKGAQVVAFTSSVPSGVRVGDSGYVPTATGGSGSSVVAISVADESSSKCSISDGEVSFLAAGDCVLEVTQASDANYEAAQTVTQTIAIAKGLQTITQTNSVPAAAFVGMGTFTPTFTGGPSGNAVTLEISSGSTDVCSVDNGVITITGAGLCRYLVNQVGDDNYEAATEFVAGFLVDKGTQVISISTSAPSDAVVGGANFTPAATGGPTGYPVVFRVEDSSVSVCSISAGVVRFVGVGTCLIGATQSGDSNYEPASDSISFEVTKGSQAISFTSTAPTTAVVGGPQYSPVATGGATANNVVFQIASASSSICALTAGKISFQSPGDCVVEANQYGNTNYNAAPMQTQTISVGKGSQVLTFVSSAPSAARVGGTTYQPIVTGGPSTSAVAFSIASAAASVCSVSNGVVSFTGVGDCVIEANQDGDTNYNAANQLTQTVSVAKGIQVVSFTSTPPSLRPVQGTTYTPTASSGGSGIAVVFTIAAEAASLCSISNGVISFQAVGDCVVYANQAGNSNWNAAPQVSQVFDITKGEQVVTITSEAPTDAVVGGTAYQPTATGGSGTKAVTYSVSALSADICSANSGSVNFLAAGVCLVVANQAGDANYNAATPVVQSINVGKGSQSVAFSSIFLAAQVEGTAYRPTANTGASVSPAIFSIASLSSAICEIVSGTVYFHAVGDCVIELNQDGDANYNPAAAVTQVISVAKGTQLPLIAQTSFESLSLGETPPTTVIGVTGGSGTGAVTWTISPASASICSLSGDVVTGLSVGYCDLVATKAGDDNFLEETVELAILVASGGQTPVRTSVSVAEPVYEPGLELALALDGGNGTGAIWFESITPEVCIVTEAGEVSVLKGGVCSVIGHKAGDENFIAAQDGLTFTIARADQGTVNLELDRTLTYSPESAVSGTLSVSGAKSSTSPSFNLVSGTCEISGTELSATEAGDCVVSVSVGQDDSYLSKTVERTFTVAKATPAALTATVVSGEPNAIAWRGKSVTHFNVAGGSGSGTISASTTTANICSVSLTDSVIEVTGLAQGTCVVSMNQATDSNYELRQTTFNVSVLDLPSAPQNFNVSNTGANQDGSMSIAVTWSAPATAATRAAVSGYEVQSKTTAANDWETVPNGELDAAATSLNVTVPPWSQVFFRVAPISSLDDENGANRNWITLTQSGTNIQVPFDVTGTLATISTNLAATTSGETVTLTGTGFDATITTRVQLSTASPVFAAGFGRAALAQTVVVPATVLSPTEIRFTLPKITLPKGRTSLATEVRILTANGISSQPVSLEYIPKKLAQTLALSGLPASKATLNIGGALVSGIATVAVVGKPTQAGATPTVTATPASVCTAAVVNRTVTVTPIGRGVCAISVVAPATPGFTASAAKTYSYTVKGYTQSITFANPGAKTYSASPLALTALSSALLPVTFSTTTTKTCSVIGSELKMIAAGPCTVTASQTGSSTVEAASKVTQTFVIAKSPRSAGLTATADSISATGERTSQTFDVTSSLAAAPVTVFVGENPVDIPVTLNKREGTLLFTVDAAADKAGICSAEPGEAGALLGSITMLDIGTCKVTIAPAEDAAWNVVLKETIVITVVGSAFPAGSVEPNPPIGDATPAPEDFDNTPGDVDTEPAVALNLDPTVSKSYSFGTEDGFAFDPASGKIIVKTRSVLVGTWTAILKSPSADKKWFKIKGKIVKKKQTYVDVASCTTKLTVKKDPKLKKKVSRVIGAGCLLSESGKAAFTAVGIQKIKMKYKRIRQYANTGLDYRGTSKAKTRILKKVNRTVVIKVGRTN